jgi:DNA helicase-2/ATP-dependent DNA helicase PcrA
MEEMLHKSGLREHYENEKDGADRLENLNELVTAAALFQEEYRSEDTEETSTPLASFLAHASLEAGEHEAGAGQDALQLMTVHAAKGLEFHAVFVSGVEEGLFPHENSISESDGIEEERRLMYVAITRARQRLYLSHAQQRMLHGQIRYGIVSRFIDEIPEELTHRIVLRDRATGFNAAPTFDLDAKPYWNKATQPANVYGASIASNMPFNIGQNVMHAKFGEGVVVNCEGRGNDARVQVKFRDSGIKWLALEYANLSTV